MKTKTDVNDRFVIIMAGGRGERDVAFRPDRGETLSSLLCASA
ncbi:MAG TPA: hypothetical protein VK840_01705 [Candidatus Dormibacteraeota bacterium]|jgi:hypothetical protein|nr:hypothetical protein [Candidatus Dormibacteraeota bacterium]